jgi:hypothetical protein
LCPLELPLSLKVASSDHTAKSENDSFHVTCARTIRRNVFLYFERKNHVCIKIA